MSKAVKRVCTRSIASAGDAAWNAVQGEIEKSRRLGRKLAKTLIEDASDDLDTIGPTIYVADAYDVEGEPIENEAVLDEISDAVQDEIIRRWNEHSSLVARVKKLEERLAKARRTPGRGRRKMKA